MLLGGRCEVLGLDEEAAKPSFVVRDGGTGLISVINYPNRSAIVEAAHSGGGGEVLATPENVSYVAGALSGWEASSVHCTCSDTTRATRGSQGEVRLLIHRSCELSTMYRPISARSW